MSFREIRSMGNQRPRILVIDDDPWMRGQVIATLRKDYFVLVATDGSDGYAKAIEFPPALAVIDIQLQGGDGFKTLRMFRSHECLAETRMLILTEDTSRSTVLSAIRHGADGYLTKSSFTPETLLKTVERLLITGARPIDEGLAAEPCGAGDFTT